MTIKDHFVVKYGRRIHPKDLGTETSKMEQALYELIEEVAYWHEFLDDDVPKGSRVLGEK